MRFIFIFLFSILITACQETPTHYTQVKIGDTTVTASVSDTDASRIRGLQFVTNLPADHGMLFIYDHPQELIHWMKDMRIPLDMIWIDQHKKVLNISANTPVCQQTPCATYQSQGPAKYVLEVNTGFAAVHHIKPGMEVDFNA